MTLPLGSRVAVVVGATGGIGAPVCRRLAGAGASVVVGFRRDAAVATALASSLPSLEGNRHSAVQVTSPTLRRCSDSRMTSTRDMGESTCS